MSEEGTGKTVSKLRYTITEAAEAASISRSRLYLMIRSGDLPVSRFGRDVGILHDDLVRILEASRDVQEEGETWSDGQTARGRSINGVRNGSRR